MTYTERKEQDYFGDESPRREASEQWCYHGA